MDTVSSSISILSLPRDILSHLPLRLLDWQIMQFVCKLFNSIAKDGMALCKKIETYKHYEPILTHACQKKLLETHGIKMTHLGLKRWKMSELIPSLSCCTNIEHLALDMFEEVTVDNFKSLPSLSSLRSLRIYETELSTSECDYIAKNFTQLTSLCLLSSAPGYTEIAHCFSQLNKLKVRHIPKGPSTSQTECGSLTSLTYLHVCSSTIPFLETAQIARLTNLRSLKLTKQSLYDEHVKIIAESLPSLTNLNLSGNNIEVYGVVTIATSLTALKILNISHQTVFYNKFLDNALLTICNQLTCLTDLNFGWWDCSDRGFADIAKLPLEALEFHCCRIGEKTFAQFVKMTNLRKLRLTITDPTDHTKHLQHIVSRLTHLTYNNSKMLEKTSQAIISSGMHLAHLNLSYLSMNANKLKEIVKQLPSIERLTLIVNRSSLKETKIAIKEIVNSRRIQIFVFADW